MLGLDLRDDTPGVPVHRCRACGLLHLSDTCRRCSARWATLAQPNPDAPISEQILQVLRTGRATHSYLARVIRAPGYLIAKALLSLQHGDQIRRVHGRPPHYDLAPPTEEDAA